MVVALAWVVGSGNFGGAKNKNKGVRAIACNSAEQQLPSVMCSVVCSAVNVVVVVAWESGESQPSKGMSRYMEEWYSPLKPWLRRACASR